MALLDFFDKDSPQRRACFLNLVFYCSPLRNSKIFQIFGCACPRIELIRRFQPSRKFVVLSSLPRVLSYTDQIDGGNGGSLQVRRKGRKSMSIRISTGILSNICPYKVQRKFFSLWRKERFDFLEGMTDTVGW